MAATPQFIIRYCWLIFIAYWLLSALTTKKIVQRKTFSSSLPYRVPVILGGVLLWDWRLPWPMSFGLTPRTDLMELAGAMVCVCGLFVTVWARWTLAGNWSSGVTFKKDHELIKTGPYRFARHPIYTGLLMMSVGLALDFRRLGCWLGILAWVIGFWIKLKQEESLMMKHFPNEYPDYRRQVKALVPFVI